MEDRNKIHMVYSLADALALRARITGPEGQPCRVHVYRAVGPLASAWVVCSERNAERVNASSAVHLSHWRSHLLSGRVTAAA